MLDDTILDQLQKIPKFKEFHLLRTACESTISAQATWKLIREEVIRLPTKLYWEQDGSIYLIWHLADANVELEFVGSTITLWLGDEFNNFEELKVEEVLERLTKVLNAHIL